jgi:hypothetical protein
MADKSKFPVPTKEQISQRAYEIYLARGREDGHDLADWIEAERELSKSNEREPETKKKQSAVASL